MTKKESGFEITDLYDLKLEEYENTMEENPFWNENEWYCTREEYREELFGSLKRGEQFVLTKYTGSSEEVTVPEGVTDMSEYLFAHNKTLRKVHLPDSLTKLNTGVFLDCAALEEVTLGKSVRTVGAQAFQSCISLKRIEFPDCVHTLREHAFDGCTELKEVKLGKELKLIRWDAFANCKSLKEIVLPESLEEISLRVFMGSGLEEIYIPKNVQLMGNGVFAGCHSLKKIEIDPDNPHMYTRDNCVFFPKNGWLLFGVGEFKMPEDGSFTLIYDSAFCGNPNIVDLHIPEGVEAIDSCAFKGCENLRTVTFPQSLERIYPLAFEKCTSLREVTIPGSVEKIERFAFGSTGLRKAVLKRGAGELCDNAFINCKELREVYLSSTVTIGKYHDPFYKCPETLKIYIEKSTEERHEQLLGRLTKFQVELVDRLDICD